MLIMLYLLLMVLSLVLWIWLTRRIWRASPLAAGTSFVLFFPAIYWCWKLWNVPQSGIRVPAIANLLITLALLGLGYKIGDAEVMRFLQRGAASTVSSQATDNHPDMNAWCRQKHGGRYDSARSTCVSENRP